MTTRGCVGEPPPWEIWPKGKPYGTPEDYCEAVTGYKWDWLVATVVELTGDKKMGELVGRALEAANARAQAENRGPGRPSKNQAVSTNLGSQGSDSKQKLLRRIARKAKEDPQAAAVLARYEKGEFKSVRAAA